MYLDRCKCSEILKEDGNYYIFDVPCVVCDEVSKIEVKGFDLFRYKQGALIQDAFNYKSSEEREYMLSGICSKCWDRMWLDEVPL